MHCIGNIIKYMNKDTVMHPKASYDCMYFIQQLSLRYENE